LDGIFLWTIVELMVDGGWVSVGKGYNTKTTTFYASLWPNNKKGSVKIEHQTDFLTAL